MRTTITIDEALYRRAKAKAALTGRTVSGVIEDAVRDSLRPGNRGAAELRPLPTYGGSGVLPGVDLTSNAAVLDLMDDDAGLDALR